MSIGAIIAWVLATIVKFILTPSIMITAGNGFLYTWVVTSVGAAIGFLSFYFLGNILFNYLEKRREGKVKKISKSTFKTLRFISKTGLRGLFLISPLAGVPLTAIIASRFFSHKKTVVPYMIICYCLWSLVLTTISYFIRTAI
ncbi:MAG: hypothetical protein ACI81Y_002812 [Glaciecola sp.]|jgi:hypothetical protein